METEPYLLYLQPQKLNALTIVRCRMRPECEPQTEHRELEKEKASPYRGGIGRNDTKQSKE